MRLFTIVVVLLLSHTPILADSHCPFNELEGTWEVFHKDASVPSKHVDLWSKVTIEFRGEDVRVTLDDSGRKWSVESGSEEYICELNGDLTVTANIVNDECKHKLSLYRVTDVSDLRGRPDKSVKIKQIEFDQYRHIGECSDHLASTNQEGVAHQAFQNPAGKDDDDVHPGHIHGDKD